MERLKAMLDASSTSSPFFPPTILYNESWLLRIVLDWFYTHKIPNHPLTFLEGARWFSEAALPSPFLNNPEGARLAEGWSHAHGVIGHFEVGKEHKIDLSFQPGGKQLVVIEAKMFSQLAAKISHVNYYDQAARTVACIVATLAIAKCSPSDLSRIGFYVLAPDSQIKRAVFERLMSRDSILKKVEQRVDGYVNAGDREKKDWYHNSFRPMFDQIDLKTLSWEDVIRGIQRYDLSSGTSIKTFYDRCVKFGRQHPLDPLTPSLKPR